MVEAGSSSTNARCDMLLLRRAPLVVARRDWLVLFNLPSAEPHGDRTAGGRIRRMGRYSGDLSRIETAAYVRTAISKGLRSAKEQRYG
jgi:hypothetical protein